MKEAKAFSPCHITGFFQILDQTKNPLQAGSRGAGVSISQGVQTQVKVMEASENSVQVKINGITSNSAEVTEHVVKAFQSRFKEAKNVQINVEHNVNLPIGTGFGTSGAAVLSLALALNEVFNLSMSRIEAAQIAHIAEVENKTGLGTVIAETFGGMEIRAKPGAPGIGEIKHVPISDDYAVVCLTFRALPTKKYLTDEKIRRRINELGGRLVDQLIEEPNVTNFLKFSRQFAEHVGLITEKIRGVLKATDTGGFMCSMPLFGESVFTLIEKESVEKILKIFQRYSSNGAIIVSEIDHEGARLL